MLREAKELTLPALPLGRTRNAGTKRNYKCLNDGPINAEVLKAAEEEARMRRLCAALPRDPNTPPRKRGRPRKERPLAADGSLPNTPSDMSTDTDASMRHYFAEGRPEPASDEEREWTANVRTFRSSPSPRSSSSSLVAMDIGGSNICYGDLMKTIEEPVKSHSPAEHAAILFLAVVEQARAEAIEKAKAEDAERARQEAAEKARAEAAEKAALEEAERAWLKAAEEAKQAAWKAAQTARNNTKARRSTKSKKRKGTCTVQKACSRRKSPPRQAI